jgi:hypothetical protein
VECGCGLDLEEHDSGFVLRQEKESAVFGKLVREQKYELKRWP